MIIVGLQDSKLKFKAQSLAYIPARKKQNLKFKSQYYFRWHLKKKEIVMYMFNKKVQDLYEENYKTDGRNSRSK